MKTFPFKTLLSCLFLSFTLASTTTAQNMVNGREVDTTFNSAMNHIFGTLDATRIPFGLLRDYAMEFTNLENFDGTALVDSNKLNKSIFKQVYTTLATARMASTAYTTLPNPDAVDSIWYFARKQGQVTLCGLFYQYSYLDPNAVNNGKITVTNGQLFDKYVNGIWQNPYLQGNVTGFAPSIGTYAGQNFNFLLPSNLWLTNSSSSISSIQFDAGDGLGYRTLTPGYNFAVNYADTGMKSLNFKVNLSSGTVLQSHSQLHIIPDPMVLYGGGLREGQPITSNGLTTTQYNNIYTAASATSYGGITGEAIVTVQFGYGHTTLVKPLIVVEGFDPGTYVNPEIPTGFYSLSNFNNSVNGSNSQSLISLITDPRTSQYDVIFIDFINNTQDIHANGMVVENVIRWANANNTGNSKIVVLGLSMGGLCARYALKSMENAGETHNVRLFISHGTPEQGAVVPLGLQYLENHLNKLYLRAGFASSGYVVYRFFFDSSLPDIGGLVSLTDQPAAQQMLINRINDNFIVDNSVHTTWQNELNTLGYPSQGGIRNIAISNGSECGQTQALAQGGQILYVDGKISTTIWGDLISEFGAYLAAYATFQPSLLLGVVPGRNDIFLHFVANAALDGGGNQAYVGKVTYRKTILWLVPINVTITNRAFNTPSGIYPYETFAGDYYNVKNLISNLSQTLTTSGWFGKYNISFNAAPQFGFGPTPSILDIGHGSATLTESDYSLPYTEGSPPPAPKNTPFANFITAFTPLTSTNVNNNEEHITYETRNGNWLANELNAQTPNIADCTALCQINSIAGDQYDCNELKTYSVPYYSNVYYTWSTGNYLQTNGSIHNSSVQIQPTSGSNGQQGTITCTMTLTNNNNGDCGPLTINRTINIGVEPLVVNSTVDRTQQQSNYQYLTATATQIPGTTTSNYTWWLTNSTGQVQYQIGSGLQLTHYPIAPCSTIYYQCQAVTPCGTATYNGYAYNTTCGGGGYAMVNQSVVIYPNPANNSMTVTNNSVPVTTDASGNPNGNVPQAYQVKLYNDKGKLLKSAQNEHGAPDVTLSTADVPDGNYFLHIIQGSNVIEKQVMIRH